jgi:magnesium-transporting ATPase (P-type)
MFMAVNDEPTGLLGFADPIKASTPEALRRRREDGVQIIILTGDSRTTAETVARTLDIEQVEAEGLPEQKGEEVHSDDEKEYSRGVYRYPLATCASHNLNRQVQGGNDHGRESDHTRRSRRRTEQSAMAAPAR